MQLTALLLLLIAAATQFHSAQAIRYHTRKIGNKCVDDRRWSYCSNGYTHSVWCDTKTMKWTVAPYGQDCRAQGRECWYKNWSYVRISAIEARFGCSYS